MRLHRGLFRPSLEHLESRWTPAGGITAVFANGALTLTGDADANQLQITQQVDDRLVLTPMMGTQVRFGNAGAYQNTPLTMPAPVTGNLSVNLLDGNDQLILDQVRLPRNVTIHGANGDNATSLQDVSVGGNLSITHQSGDDATTTSGNIAVVGNLSISHGNGASVIEDLLGTMVVGGNATLSDGTGPARITWDTMLAVEVCGQLNINHGAADASTNRTNIFPVNRLELGSLSITNGAGVDTNAIGASLVTIHGSTNIKNGNGDQFTQLLGSLSLVTGPLSFTSGTGDDFTTINSGGAVSIVGNVSIQNGQDSDFTSTLIFASSSLTVSGDISVRNGSGMDDNRMGSFAGASIRVLGNIDIQNGSGGANTSIGSLIGMLSVQGTTQITGTAGADHVVIGGVNNQGTSLGNVSVSSGNDANETSILGSTLVVNGMLTVTGGSGDDDFALRSSLGNATIARSVNVNLGGGSGQLVALGAGLNGQFVTIGQGLTIDTSGNTLGVPGQLFLDRVNVLGSTSITTGSGNDFVGINESIFNAFSIRTNAGDDQIVIEDKPFSTNTTRFRGPFSAVAGDGNDLVVVGLSTDPVLRQGIFVTASNAFNGGSGNDELRLFTMGSATFFAGAPLVSLFEMMN